MPKYDRHPITGCRVSSFVSDQVVWMIDPIVFEQIVNEAKMKMQDPGFWQRANKEETAEDKPEPLYQVDGDVAVISMSGCITKYPTSFGNASTVQTQKAFRAALQDDKVSKILLRMESPGGTSSGVPELADYIHKASDKKPVFTFADGIMCSAAYYIGSVGKQVMATRDTQIGSIGTAALLRDTSKAYEQEGIKVIPVATSEFKLTGAPGVPVTDVQVEEIARRVKDVNDYFVQDVAKYRQIPESSIRDLKARVYMGDEALTHKLVDRITNFDQAMQYVKDYTGKLEVPSLSDPSAAIRGPADSVQTLLAADRSSEMSFTTDQMKLIRDKFPTAVQKSDGEIYQWATDTLTQLNDRCTQLNGQCETLQKNQKPTLDVALADERRTFVTGSINQLEKDGFITTAQKDQLTTVISKDSPLMATMLQREPDGTYLMDKVLATFRNSTTRVVTQQQSSAAPKVEQRSAPGDTVDAFKQASDKVVDGIVDSRYRQPWKKAEAAARN